ncbi:MAG TPA: YdcF family protein [Terriglobales bacterium]|jgi:uncharacterized SAM-binding protein YcdF (DUF218 family)|nr:YdcF family protein [Terriglobales bacterium]
MASSRRSRIWLRFLGILVAVALGWVAAVYWLVSRQADQDESRQAEAIVVFGAAEYSGHPSPIYRARLDHAYTLFKKGMAPLIITTGGAAEDPSFSEGGVGRDYLVSRGVPDGDIIAETQSSDTSQSAARVANILRANGLHNCVAVSDGYHMFRVKQMLERQAITVYASPRPDSRLPSRWERMRVKLREVMSYTAWRLGL